MQISIVQRVSDNGENTFRTEYGEITRHYPQMQRRAPVKSVPNMLNAEQVRDKRFGGRSIAGDPTRNNTNWLVKLDKSSER